MPVTGSATESHSKDPNIMLIFSISEKPNLTSLQLFNIVILCVNLIALDFGSRCSKSSHKILTCIRTSTWTKQILFPAQLVGILSSTKVQPQEGLQMLIVTSDYVVRLEDDALYWSLRRRGEV